MQTVNFDPAGGPIVVRVECVPNRNGSYKVLLWEAGKNQVVKEYAGNFINADDDAFTLDPPDSAHDGRLVEALVVVAIPSGVGPSDVTLSVLQKGLVLGGDTAIVAPGSPAQMVDLYVKLVKR